LTLKLENQLLGPWLVLKIKGRETQALTLRSNLLVQWSHDKAAQKPYKAEIPKILALMTQQKSHRRCRCPSTRN
jgi:hypothetical protein